MNGDEHQVRRVREAAGCLRLCSLSSEYRPLALAIRYRHNGVSFSRACDVDMVARRMFPDEGDEVLTRWCQEHHAGRDGREIPIAQPDGSVWMALVPEAVDA